MGPAAFEIGFERAGIRTVLQAESDPWCLEVLKRHWPEVDRVDDVRSVHKDDTPPLRRRDGDLVSPRRGTDPQWIRLQRRGGIATGSIDLVYGGFPCQDVSVAGKRAGLRGDRSGLFYEFARVVRELRPRWFAIENVPGLLSSADGADFGAILGIMVERGYGVAWRILDGRWFGVPQRRRRVLVVGCLGDPRRAAQVLAVCESCGGHPAPSPTTREGVAASLSGGSHASGVNLPGRHKEDDVNLVVAGTLGSHHGNVRADQAWTGQLVSGTIDASYGRLQGASGQDAGHSHDTLVLARSQTARQERLAGDSDNFVVAGALRASDGHHGHSSPRGDGADNLIAFDWMAAGSERTRTVSPGDYARSSGTRNHTAISGGMGVRRLTPLECERLMGWPDEWTRWTSDGREIVDSHRYRMCGNGVIAPVAEWLGHRLMRADQLGVVQ